MSRRALVVGATVALVVGLAGGYALGRVTAMDPSLSGELTALRATLRPVRDGVELAATEYAQGVKGGSVVAPTEYSAARADVRRAREALDSARDDLRVLDPQGAASLDRAVAALAAAVAGRVPAGVVRARSAAAVRALDGVLPERS